jgi:hypothetical protein
MVALADDVAPQLPGCVLADGKNLTKALVACPIECSRPLQRTCARKPHQLEPARRDNENLLQPARRIRYGRIAADLIADKVLTENHDAPDMEERPNKVGTAPENRCHQRMFVALLPQPCFGCL